MTIGLGTAAIGRPHYINIRQKENSEDFDKNLFIQAGKQILTQAYQQGIRYFDTAPGYGIAEQILLEWLQENNRPDIFVSTKWGYTYVANFDPNASTHEIKEHSLEKLNEQWEFSSQLLPFLNLYQIHSATLESGVLDNIKVLERLFELKENHQIEIGLSTSGANQNEIIKKALEVKVNGNTLFDSFQVTYNIFDQSLGQITELLSNHRLIIKEALANGRIFPNQLFKNYQNSYEVLAQLATKYNTSIDTIALRFCMDSINSKLVLSGATEEHQLVSNLQVNNISLSDEDVEQLKTLAVSPELYWNERKQLVWN